MRTALWRCRGLMLIAAVVILIFTGKKYNKYKGVSEAWFYLTWAGICLISIIEAGGLYLLRKIFFSTTLGLISEIFYTPNLGVGPISSENSWINIKTPLPIGWVPKLSCSWTLWHLLSTGHHKHPRTKKPGFSRYFTCT